MNIIQPIHRRNHAAEYPATGVSSAYPATVVSRLLVVIVGPTSSGKTKLAVDLARKFNGEIVSADSRQVYRGMDIGTGKDLKAYVVTKSLRDGDLVTIPHHLIDIVSPRTNFTLAQYQKLAYRAIEDILRRDKLPILVGGTGLYVQAVVDGYVIPAVPPDPKLRARLAKLSLSQLHGRLKNLDPATYRVIDKDNRRRLERAIEICMGTGIPLSEQRKKQAPPYNLLMLGLALPREVLDKRIDARLKERLQQGMVPPLARGGMVAEVRRLHKQGISWKRLESFGLEYKYVARYIHAIRRRDTFVAHAAAGSRGSDRHRLVYNMMVNELSAAIKDFSRRQMTWFKRDKRIVWIHNKKEAEKLVRAFARDPSRCSG